MSYVTYNDRRYRVISYMASEDTTPDRMRLRPFRGPDVIVSVASVKPWTRGSVRRFKGKQPHRGKRPVRLLIDTAKELVTARLSGGRIAFTCTFGGLYDLLARQQVLNAKRDREFARRTGKRRRA